MIKIIFSKSIIYLLAITSFFSPLFVHGQDHQVYLDTALNKVNEGAYQAGIDYCNKALEVNSQSELAYFYRAGFHTALIRKQNVGEDYKHYKAAVADYSKALEFDEKYTDALFFRGGAHSSMGFLDLAVKDYLAAISINDNQPKIYNSLAICKAKLGDTKQALIYINKALDLDENYAKAYSSKGNICDMMGDKSQACENWGKSIELGYEGSTKSYYTSCR